MDAGQAGLEEPLGAGLFARLRDFGREHGLDESHALQVARLALRLFDGTEAIHGLGPPERRLLLSAAYLHDVGMCRGLRGHHKSSLDIISAGDLAPLDRRELRLVACIARYHRKSHPRRKHEHFSRLAPGEQEGVARLASLLRVADALDREHDAAVKDLEVEISNLRVLVKAQSSRGLGAEEVAMRRKGRLFEELFGLHLALRAVPPPEGR